jgi:hypothetical protein
VWPKTVTSGPCPEQEFGSCIGEAVKHLPKNALAMRRDVSLMKMLRERQYPVAQMEWSLETDDAEDATQKAVADKYTKRVPQLSPIPRTL